MTRKDYEAIAAAIREARSTQAHEDARLAAPSGTRFLMAAVEHNIARALAADNPRFDRERFLKACGAQ